MKQLKTLVRTEKKSIVALFFTSILIAITIIAQAYLIVAIVDSVFLQNKSFYALMPLLVVLMVVFIMRTTLSYFHSRIGIQMGATVKEKIRKLLIKKYKKDPISLVVKGQTGNRISIFLDSIDEIDPYFSKYYPQKVLTSVVPILIFLTVLYHHSKSAIIMAITAPLIPFFMIVIGQATEKKAKFQMEKLAAFSGQFLDILQGIVTLKLFKRAKQKREVIYKDSIAYRDATMDVLKIAFVSSLLVEFISMIGIALIAFDVGLQLVVFEQISFFTAFFVLLLAPEFYNQFKELGSAYHAGKGSAGAAEKVFEELKEKEERQIVWGNEILINSPPQIELKNVSFRYGGKADPLTLHKVSAKIAPMSEVAIVGRSGVGKTTLLHLIAGIYKATDGEIEIDGQPLLSYEEGSWYDQIIYISQDPYLFAGTLKENIIIGANKAQITEKNIAEACEKAGLSELISSLKQGYNTVIGEGGRGLSGGEKQRVVLARAFLKKPSIILFDEPTVGLDLQTEHILQKSIKLLSQNATMITVAHRLYTVKKASQILFMDGGTVVASGTHSELLKLNREYEKMFTAQQKGVL